VMQSARFLRHDDRLHFLHGGVLSAVRDLTLAVPESAKVGVNPMLQSTSSVLAWQWEGLCRAVPNLRQERALSLPHSL